MILLTVGELIMAPTSTTLTAALAPPSMRGRYMGVLTLTWGISFGIGPVLGGILSDQFAPAAIWYGGLVMGLAAALGFLVLSRSARKGNGAVGPPGTPALRLLTSAPPCRR